MVLFLFLVIALVVVVGAVTLAVVSGGESGALPDAAPERLTDPLPPDRPLRRADVDAMRFPLTLRGYEMADVDDALSRLGAELAERDARIAELEAALAGVQATAVAGPALFDGYTPRRRSDAEYEAHGTSGGRSGHGGTPVRDEIPPHHHENNPHHREIPLHHHENPVYDHENPVYDETPERDDDQ